MSAPITSEAGERFALRIETQTLIDILVPLQAHALELVNAQIVTPAIAIRLAVAIEMLRVAHADLVRLEAAAHDRG